MKKLIVLLLLFVGGCGEKITHGTITGRDHTPGHYKTVTEYTYVDFDDDGISDIDIPHDRKIYVKPTWTLTFGRIDGEGTERSRTITIDEDTYNSYKVGDSYNMYGNQAEAE